jgi:drug/metabolite transporter (DMT)-like permease
MNSSSDGLHLKTFILLLVMVTFGPLGDAFLGKGMRRVDSSGIRNPADLFHFFLRAFSSETVWIGILLLATFFAAYTLVLSWADFSFVQPASSFAYAIVALLGHYFLGEFVSTTRWLGILIICGGVLVVGTTPPSTTERVIDFDSASLAPPGRS